MFDKSLKKELWPNGTPDKKLWKKFKDNFPVKTILKEEIKFKQLDLGSLEQLARSEAFNFFQQNYQTLLYKNGAIQKVHNCTQEAENLISLMKKTSFKKEFLQIIFLTNSGKIKSSVLEGTENKVSSLNEIKKIILETRFELEKNGLDLKSIHILHTHPSLELMVTTKDKTFLNIHPLSRSDINFLRELQYHFKWPLSLSAVTPSGVQYTASFENILDS